MEDELKRQIESKDSMIKTLQDGMKLKDDQIETIKDSMKLKDDQIKTLESSIQLKEEKIETLQKTLELKEEQIKNSSGSVSDAGDVAGKDKEIEELKKEIDVLNSELTKADEDLEALEQEIDKIKKEGSGGSDSGVLDFTNADIPHSEIIEEMREILHKALHNVMMVVPTISDLQELYLYEVRSSVNMKISCLIDPGIEDHSDLLEEFESLDNISLRTYEGEDRFIIIRDGEELFFAIIGTDENNHLVFKTKDSKHITFLNSLVMESWLRGRKI